VVPSKVFKSLTATNVLPKLAGAQILSKDACIQKNTMNCPMVYAPVCGTVNGVQTTYTNHCVATASGAQIVSKEACVDANQTKCPMIYEPVCGTINGTQTTLPMNVLLKLLEPLPPKLDNAKLKCYLYLMNILNYHL